MPTEYHEAPRLSKRRRTKDGCRPCRVRKKKCDGRRPICVSCERNVLLCSWFSPSSDSNPSEHSGDARGSTDGAGDIYAVSPSPSSPSTPYPEESGISTPSALPVFLSQETVLDLAGLRLHPSVEPVFRSPTSTLLYQHWIEQTGNVISAKRGRANAFITELPRLALAYPDTVLQSLLAISGVHYCNGHDSLDVETATWTHLGLALRSLKYGLTKMVSHPGGCDPVPLLTTALVMCFLENTRGDVSGNMSHHLRAAHTLFNSALSSHSMQMDESIFEFLKEFYIYLTRITEISYDSECPPSETECTDPDPNAVGTWISPKSHGMLVGCSYELFNMIPRVAALSRRKRERLRRTKSGRPMTDEMSEELEQDTAYYYAMRSQILAWQPPANAHRDFITCGEIYRQAVLCYLDISFADPAVLAQPEAPDFVHACFNNLNQLLEILPLDAYITSTLCWPMALFGSLAKDEAQRAVIYNRLQAMWDVMRLGNITATMRFLERLWADLRSGSIVLVGSIECPSPEKNGKNKPVDLTDMEGLMRRYNLLLSFA